MVGDILQPTHLLFVLIVALLVLGPKRLPEVGRALGDGLRDFKSAINGESHPHHEEIDRESNPPEPEADDHEFAHQASATEAPMHEEPGATSHEFASADPQQSGPVADDPGQAATAGEKHEFAYESSDPAPTRDEPAS